MGVQGRLAASARDDGSLPHGDPLSRPRHARRCAAAAARGGHPIDGATDHGVSEAIYLRDPDENGVELYRDRPEAEWPRNPDGTFTMFNAPFDLEALLAEAS